MKNKTVGQTYDQKSHGKEWDQKKETGIKHTTKDVKTPHHTGGFDKKTSDKKDLYHK